MIKVVSGFVPLVDHPRGAKEYEELGKQLINLDIDIAVAHTDISRCWLYQFLQWRNKEVTHSIADNPQKNTIAYHIVNHQKTEWMIDVAYLDPAPDVFAWIDYGIFSVPGVSASDILEFLKRAANEQSITIPGCWEKNERAYDDKVPNWRFCGGVIVCPRRYLFALDGAMKAEKQAHIERTGNVSWEVNTLARIERRGGLPIWWYRADHNETLFKNYPESKNAG